MSVEITPELKSVLLRQITEMLASNTPPFEVVFITNWHGGTAEVITVEGGLPNSILTIQFTGEPLLPLSFHCIANLSWVMDIGDFNLDEEDEEEEDD